MYMYVCKRKSYKKESDGLQVWRSSLHFVSKRKKVHFELTAACLERRVLLL